MAFRIFGYIKDPQEHRKPHFSMLMRAAGLATESIPDALDITMCPVLNQGYYIGSCVGHGGVGAVYTTLAWTSAPLLWIPSPGDAYKLAREIDRAHDYPHDAPPALKDSGTMPSSVFQAFSTFGCRPMGKRAKDPDNKDGPGDPSPRYSDCDLNNVNLEEDFEDAMADRETLLAGQHSITGSLADLVRAVRVALFNRLTVNCGNQVGTAFQAWTPDQQAYDPAQDDDDPDAGGHDTFIVGCRKNPSTGRYEFKLQNSWGEDWGDHGFGWVTDMWLARSTDLDVVSVQRVK